MTGRDTSKGIRGTKSEKEIEIKNFSFSERPKSNQKMSNDEVRWCDNDNEDESIDAADVNDSYTFRSVYHIKEDDDQISVINIHKHRNVRLKRDSRRNDTVDSTPLLLSSQQQSSSPKCLNSSLCLITVILLHLLCNFVSNVNCDESMDAVGARGHYTHTWAVHIPGGERVAREVADEHGMNFRGKVS